MRAEKTAEEGGASVAKLVSYTLSVACFIASAVMMFSVPKERFGSLLLGGVLIVALSVLTQIFKRREGVVIGLLIAILIVAVTTMILTSNRAWLSMASFG